MRPYTLPRMPLEMRFGVVILALTCILTGCSDAGRRETFYVVISEPEAEQYFRDMIAAVTRVGLNAYPGTLNNNRGRI